MKIESLIKTEFACMAAKEEMAHTNKLNRLLFSLSVSGVMSNTVWTETFMPLGEINSIERGTDLQRWLFGVNGSRPCLFDEADSERCEQMTNFTSHYLLIIQPFAI